MSLLGELDNEPPKVADGTVLEGVVQRDLLAAALAEVQPAVPTGDVLPVLKNFRFSILESGVLHVAATDTTVTILAQTEMFSTTKAGVAVFPPARLTQIVHEASESVSIKVISKNGKFSANIASGKAKWVIPLMSPTGFPDLSDHLDHGTVETGAQGFKKALDQVRKAASTDHMRPYYMLVDISKGRVTASDGQRSQQVIHDFPFDCQVPVRAAALVSQKIKPKVETVEVGQTNNALLFRFGSTLLIAQKTMAQFPDVDEILLLPTLGNDQNLYVGREALLDAVKRVRIVADPDTAAVVLSLNKGSVSVQAKDSKDGGTAVETVPAKWELSPRHVSLNHAYFVDMLSSTDTEMLRFRLGKDLLTKPSPLVMDDKEANGLTAVLSQIRIDWL